MSNVKDFQVTQAEQDTLLRAIEVLKRHGLKEARIRVEDRGEAWIIRQTARLLVVESGPSGSSSA